MTLPHGSCDCHTHVFLDAQAFPFWPSRRYTPPPATIEALAQRLDALGLERVVIVQPSVYGPDNAATLQALRVLGPGRARGVAVIEDDVTDAALNGLHAAGVRGVRVNLEVDGASDPAPAAAAMRRTAERVAPWGWHVQVYASMPLLAACSATLGALPVPVVLDHFAGARAGQGAQQEGLGPVLKLVESGKAYVKLSAPYRCATRDGYTDIDPLAALFIQANPQRMVWGSDWPHPRPGSQPLATDISQPFDIDAVQVLAQLRRWAGDDAMLKTILADNPQRLYDFKHVTSTD
ncbi:MAG: amidohydrolase family protein [Pseudomonadota bacterium]